MQTPFVANDLVERVQVLLNSLPDSESAARFLGRLRQESPDGFKRIDSSTAALRCAVHIFSYSSFLSEACLKNPEALWEASRPGSLERLCSKEDYQGLLTRTIGAGVPAALELASFRRRELFRIVLRDVLGMAVL